MSLCHIYWRYLAVTLILSPSLTISMSSWLITRLPAYTFFYPSVLYTSDWESQSDTPITSHIGVTLLSFRQGRHDGRMWRMWRMCWLVDTRGVPVFGIVHPSLYPRVTRVLMGVDITGGTGGDVTTRGSPVVGPNWDWVSWQVYQTSCCYSSVALHDIDDIIIMYPSLFTLEIKHCLYILMVLFKHLSNNATKLTASIYYDESYFWIFTIVRYQGRLITTLGWRYSS